MLTSSLAYINFQYTTKQFGSGFGIRSDLKYVRSTWTYELGYSITNLVYFLWLWSVATVHIFQRFEYHALWIRISFSGSVFGRSCMRAGTVYGFCFTGCIDARQNVNCERLKLEDYCQLQSQALIVLCPKTCKFCGGKSGHDGNISAWCWDYERFTYNSVGSFFIILPVNSTPFSQ